MGSPKAFLEIAGKSFLRHVTEALHEGGVNEIVVVVGGTDTGPIESAFTRLKGQGELSVVTNPDPSRGQVSSLRCGIQAAGRREEVEAHIVHPVDIPGVVGADVTALLHAAEAHLEADAVLPSVGGRQGHPVLLRKELARRVCELPPDRTLRDLLSSPDVTIEYVERENGLLRFDVDTPEDLKELASRWSR